MPPLEVYEGDCPYIFASYAHADDRVVLPIIGALVAEGYRVWYDDGIQPAAYFPDYIAGHIHDCACFVMFVSRASLDSPWCKREVKYALDCRKSILPVYLEDVELTRGLKLILGSVQSVFWHRYESDEVFYRRMFDIRVLADCLTDEGRRRRGVKPRPIGNGTTASLSYRLAVKHVVDDEVDLASGILKSWASIHAPSALLLAHLYHSRTPKDSLDDYHARYLWDEVEVTIPSKDWKKIGVDYDDKRSYSEALAFFLAHGERTGDPDSLFKASQMWLKKGCLKQVLVALRLSADSGSEKAKRFLSPLSSCSADEIRRHAYTDEAPVE